MATTALASKPSRPPLSMMEALSPTTYLYRPAVPAATDPSPSAPKLILVCSWMDAQDVHIAKYVSRYQALFPASPILLVKFVFAHVQGAKKAVEHLQPAIPVIRAVAEADARDPKAPTVLAHVFSNGGSMTLARLYAAYRAAVTATGRAGEPAQLPRHVTVFDSCPGRFGWRRSVAALAPRLGGPSRWARWLLRPLAHLLVAYWWFSLRVLRRRDRLAAAGAAHNDRSQNGSEARRAYVYSEADALVGWRAVEDNAEDARRKGYAVRLVKFEGSPHVAHMRADPERYWKVVVDAWDGVD
jgi:hypothetical protein